MTVRSGRNFGPKKAPSPGHLPFSRSVNVNSEHFQTTPAQGFYSLRSCCAAAAAAAAAVVVLHCCCSAAAASSRLMTAVSLAVSLRSFRATCQITRTYRLQPAIYSAARLSAVEQQLPVLASQSNIQHCECDIYDTHIHTTHTPS